MSTSFSFSSERHFVIEKLNVLSAVQWTPETCHDNFTEKEIINLYCNSKAKRHKYQYSPKYWITTYYLEERVTQFVI